MWFKISIRSCILDDEKIGIDGNIKNKKYENIGRNINKILISIKIQNKWRKFIKIYIEIFNET